MTPKLRGVCGLVFGLLWLAIPVLAHHSLTAEFDTSRSFSVKGTIAKLEWVNPHVYLYLDVMDQDGNVTLYSFGSAPPGLLRRAGVVRTMFNVGDAVTIDAFPAKDGSKRLGFRRKFTLRTVTRLSGVMPITKINKAELRYPGRPRLERSLHGTGSE